MSIALAATIPSSPETPAESGIGCDGDIDPIESDLDDLQSPSASDLDPEEEFDPEEKEESLRVRDLFKFMKSLATLSEDIRFFPPTLAFIEQTQTAFKQNVPLVIQSDYVLGSVAVFELFPNKEMGIAVDIDRISKFLGIIAPRLDYPLRSLEDGRGVLKTISPRATSPIPGVAIFVDNDSEYPLGVDPIEATQYFPFVITNFNGEISVFFNFELIAKNLQEKSLVVALQPADLIERQPVGMDQYRNSLKSIFRITSMETLPESMIPDQPEANLPVVIRPRRSSLTSSIEPQSIREKTPFVPTHHLLTLSMDEARIRDVEADLIRRGLILPSNT